MLAESTIAYLNALTFRPDANRLTCWIPLGGIYWDDELPDIRLVYSLPEPERSSLRQLIRIRLQIWSSEQLSPADQQFWDEARQQAPQYALFRRLELSDEVRRVHEAMAQGSDELFAAMQALADEHRPPTERDPP